MKFSEAYQIVMKHEGGYVNDRDDRGGETYKGIARKYHTTWEGWKIVDKLKRSSGFPRTLDSNQTLQSYVKSFYKKKYWDVHHLDSINISSVQLELFDTGVNMGVKRAGMFFQEALNLCNRNQRDYADIKVDGAIGRMTLTAFGKARATSIFKTMNLLQGEYYMKMVRNNPTQEKFFNGWLNRVDIKFNI